MRVLVAIDGINCAQQVVEFVTRHDWPKDTQLMLVNIVCPITLDMPMASYPNFLESISQAAQEDARQLLKSAAISIQAKTSIKPCTDVLIGHPTQMVVSIAKDWKADLVILGSHGRHGLDRFFYGSVSSDVASEVPCSVMVLRLPPAIESEKAEEATMSRKVAGATA
jgi:nucleotide-binding universal stress UspA family protein